MSLNLSVANARVAVIGLGYVGLPLAVAFAEKYPVIGFDISEKRILELQNGVDCSLEVDEDLLKSVRKKESTNVGISFTVQPANISCSNVFIITVPTPTDKNNRPVLTPLYKASETVGRILKKGDVVIYESTVYPGVTEEECVPVLEKFSGLRFNEHFVVGYSPERINPGDKVHTVTKVVKVTSGSTSEAAEFVDELYKSIITAGTYRASSIKVAEAAKVIENSQRDINIAFVNELSKIFNRLGIDTHEVLQAAGTKWNFLNFKPGLVGGHCIGVDPYYLAQKAQESGYHPEIILAGRRMNDEMGVYIAKEVIKLMVKKDIHIKNSNVLILGFTFKENCSDIRNTRVVDVVNEFRSFGTNVTVFDPWAKPADVMEEYGLVILNDQILLQHQSYDAVVLTVAHDIFRAIDLQELKCESSVVYDVQAVLNVNDIDARL